MPFKKRMRLHLTKGRAATVTVNLTLWVSLFLWVAAAHSQLPKKQIVLPSSKILMEPVPGMPRPVNSFPATLAVHPSRRYVAILNNGYGTEESRFQQSIGI